MSFLSHMWMLFTFAMLRFAIAVVLRPAAEIARYTGFDSKPEQRLWLWAGAGVLLGLGGMLLFAGWLGGWFFVAAVGLAVFAAGVSSLDWVSEGAVSRWLSAHSWEIKFGINGGLLYMAVLVFSSLKQFSPRDSLIALALVAAAIFALLYQAGWWLLGKLAGWRK